MAKLAMLLLLAAVAVAMPMRQRRKVELQLSSSSVQENENSAEEKHRLEMDVESDRVEIESKYTPAGGNETSVKFKFRTDGGEPRIDISFETESGNTETETSFRLEFRSMFHFVPSGAIDAGYAGETKTNTVALSSLTWSPINCTDIGTSGDFTGVLACIIKSTDDSVIIKINMAGSTFSKNGFSVDPKQAKIQVALNYPPQAGEPSGVVNALQLMMRTKVEFGAEDDSASSEVEFGGAAIFKWEDTFLDDASNEGPVIASELVQDTTDDGDEGEDDRDFVQTFTFARADVQSVNWDPVFGASTASSSSSGLSTGTIVGIAVGSVVGIALIVVLVVALTKRGS